jgi:hypothetical protein
MMLCFSAIIGAMAKIPSNVLFLFILLKLASCDRRAGVDSVFRKNAPVPNAANVTCQPRTTNRLGACVVPTVPRRLVNGAWLPIPLPEGRGRERSEREEDYRGP